MAYADILHNWFWKQFFSKYTYIPNIKQNLAKLTSHYPKSIKENFINTKYRRQSSQYINNLS